MAVMKTRFSRAAQRILLQRVAEIGDVIEGGTWRHACACEESLAWVNVFDDVICQVREAVCQ